MSIKIQSPTLDTGEATALLKKFQKMKHNLSKIRALFVTFSFFARWFWYRFSQKKEKVNVKESLHKNLEHWHHIDLNPSVIDTIENGYSRLKNCVLWNNQSALQNEYFVTYTVKNLFKSGRIKDSRTPFYIVNPLTVAKSSHKKPRFILNLWDTFLLFIGSE